MDEAVDQVMGRSSDEKGAEKAVAIRRSQQKERARLQSEIAAEQKLVAAISEERAPIAAEVRKVEAEVGPLKYIAAFVYGATDESVLERAVTWVIITIIVVFDPLAVIMLLAAQMTFGWKKEDEDEHLLHNTVPHTETPVPLSINDVVPQPQEYIPEEETEPELVAPEWPFPSSHELQTHTEEVPGETPLTALGGDITATEEKPVETVEDLPLEQWNKMIEEAEKAVQEETSVDIQGEAKKYSIIPELQAELDAQRLKPDLTEVIESEESKKKTYMTKDDQGKIQVKETK
jgi:hypothetical protein